MSKEKIKIPKSLLRQSLKLKKSGTPATTEDKHLKPEKLTVSKTRKLRLKTSNKRKSKSSKKLKITKSRKLKLRKTKTASIPASVATKTSDTSPTSNTSPTSDADCKKLKNKYKGQARVNINEPEYQQLLKCIATENRDQITRHGNDYDFLYPNIDDPEFNIKIASRKEFYNTRYEKKSHKDYENIKEIAEMMCNETEFELEPHQKFIQNFMSFQTPYNGLLLYHGLGTGKTCSAISVCEEMRTYLKHLGKQKRIIIVASPAVQENFKLQLFDERKLRLVNGLWNIKSCTGNKFIRELNPVNMKNLDRSHVIHQIKKIISQSYAFKGYIEFSNYIENIMNAAKKIKRRGDSPELTDESMLSQVKIDALRREFSDRLVVIDEVHNLRALDTANKKRSSENLLHMVSSAENMKLLLLSATPMFNDYTEIIWLLNVLNLNDKRFTIRERDIFDYNGDFQRDKDGNEVGKQLLIQKMTGYISYVKGNNPFSFPYGIYPEVAQNPNSLMAQRKNNMLEYPSVQLNGSEIEEPIEILDLITTDIGDYQSHGYEFVLEAIKERYAGKVEPGMGLAYTILEPLLQSLNMIYPVIQHSAKSFKRIDDDDDDDDNDDEPDEDDETDSIVDDDDNVDTDDVKEGDAGKKDKSATPIHKDTILDNLDIESYTKLYGREGLNEIMIYNKQSKRGFKYRNSTLEQYGRIFSPSEIGKYSAKIHYICEQIRKSKGIVFIYSQYIDGGTIPMALALEEMGITRYGNVKSLFNTQPVPNIDAITMKANKVTYPAKYIMITGDKQLTPNVKLDLKAVTSADNINGSKVKVVIVSRAGSEGLDFKNIRQMHLLDPWYNLNRSDQIIGRAIRNKSHCDLPFEKRNVEIFLYSTILKTKNIESADMYIYRLAENKAKKISVITRLLKENAIDCLLNRDGLDFSERVVGKTIKQELSTGNVIDYKVGDADGSQACDFMACEYKCKSPHQTIQNVNTSTYNKALIELNLDIIIKRIRMLFKEYYILERIDLIKLLTQTKSYPLEQINSALNFLVTGKNEYITDMLGRTGNLINIGTYYLFQPIEIKNHNISSFERKQPLDYKRKSIVFNLPEVIPDYEFETAEDDVAGEHKGPGTKNVDRTVGVTSTRGDKFKGSMARNVTHILIKLEEIYNNLVNPAFIIPSDKTNWVKTAGWVIKNLETHNSISKEVLLQLAMFHVLDSLDYKSKLLLLQLVYTDAVEIGVSADDNVQKIIVNYFDKFVVKTDKWEGIALADFNASSTRSNMIILTKNDDNKWAINRISLQDGLEQAIIDKFLVMRNIEFNSHIGFMIGNEKTGIIFKTKDMKPSTKNRLNTGKRCSRGQHKNELIAQINNLLVESTGIVKYKLQGKKIASIYDNAKYNQYVHNPNKNRDEIVKISNFQLCIEIELLMRYFDEIKQNNKRWFFNTIGTIINDIVNKKI